ncbi:MAG: hypothetical protein ACYCSR_05635 [Thiomonas sp.]|uniref:Uncharacterized protein n=1 Tax=mine drainage metagenome TaxID=410659 RepID=E6PL90_9ZZZZ
MVQKVSFLRSPLTRATLKNQRGVVWQFVYTCIFAVNRPETLASSHLPEQAMTKIFRTLRLIQQAFWMHYVERIVACCTINNSEEAEPNEQ